MAIHWLLVQVLVATAWSGVAGKALSCAVAATAP
jgi:hypothetical protein